MKSDIHPKINPVVFVDASTGAKFVATSTMKSEETEKIDGIDHFVIKVDVSSDSHPFYTGKQKLIDTAGRVDKFREKMEKAKKLQEEAEKKRKKKAGEDDDEVEEKNEESKVESPKTEVEDSKEEVKEDKNEEESEKQ